MVMKTKDFLEAMDENERRIKEAKRRLRILLAERREMLLSVHLPNKKPDRPESQ